MDYGVALNPVAATVRDSATSLILMCGSRETRKWLFLKRTFLPFLANELFANLAATVGSATATVSVRAFEVLDGGAVRDLQRPSGVAAAVFASEVVGLQAVTARNVAELTFYLVDAAEKRTLTQPGAAAAAAGSALPSLSPTPSFSSLTASAKKQPSLLARGMPTKDSSGRFGPAPGRDGSSFPPGVPPAGALDVGAAVWEIEVTQREPATDRVYSSRILVVDLPEMDAAEAASPPPRLPAVGYTSSRGQPDPALAPAQAPAAAPAARPLLAFEEYVGRLAAAASSAPFRTSPLTHYLADRLGGDAVVVALGFLAQGEPATSRRTIELVDTLSKLRHFPVGRCEPCEASDLTELWSPH